jgi:hypothetical protein
VHGFQCVHLCFSVSQTFELEFASDLELLIRSFFLSQGTVHQGELEMGLALRIVANSLLQCRLRLGKLLLHVIRFAQVAISGPLIRIGLQCFFQMGNSLGRFLLIEKDRSHLGIGSPVVWV